jgi:large subunit ribosomal protein L9
MKVVLTAHIKGFGQKGDVKEVSDGYFQNFLAPRKLATIATSGTVNLVQAQKAKAVEKLENMKESANAIKERINGKTCNLPERCSEGGKLYAALREKEVRAAIKTQLNADVPEKQIKMDAIKTTGSYPVEIDLYKDVKAKVQVIVTAA